MAIDEAALGAELQGRHGVTTRERLRRLGISDRVIHGLTTRGRLVPLGRGVYIDRGSPCAFEQRMAVACAVTGGVVCFPTAGAAWKFRKTPRVPDIHVLVPWTRRVTSFPGIVIHRSRDLDRCDVVRRRDGIALTSPPRTVFDATATVSRDDLESMIEQGIQRGNFVVATLWMLNKRLATNARARCRDFASVLAERPAWRRPVDSDHELRLERAMRARGFPPLTRGHAIEIAPGIVVHPDLGLPEDGFYVEVDHLSWHGVRLESAYDRWRDMQVRKRGNYVERVSDIALDRELDDTIEDLWTLWQLRRGRSCTESVHDLPRRTPS